jgi:hypothetical protein
MGACGLLISDISGLKLRQIINHDNKSIHSELSPSASCWASRAMTLARAARYWPVVRDVIGGQEIIGQVVDPRQRNVDLPF